MQASLFGDDPEALLIKPATLDTRLVELADSLPTNVYLGTSSWSYPGWKKLMWEGDYTETQLSRYGLTAYGRHPLFRTVSIDRSFYGPLSAAQYAQYASQVGPDFRFMVKAPRLVTDSYVRDDRGVVTGDNPLFLDPATTLKTFVEPVTEGLGSKLGVLVLQISPLLPPKLRDMPRQINRLHRLLKAMPDIQALSPSAIFAVEVRNSEWLTPEFANVLKDGNARYCLGLHEDMPNVNGQLDIVRSLWPGPFVCRWNLNRGGPGHDEAAKRYGPFDKIMSPTPATHAELVPVIQGTAKAGHDVFVTISNNTEGCAPLSVIELARRLKEST